ncbi:MAG: hypothetical protein DRG33_08210, partial [Deltaproteobacteria bacterium]
MDKIKKALEKAEKFEENIQTKTTAYSKKVGKELVPVYTQTRVVPIDEKILLNNKIYSYFQDNLLTEQLRVLRTKIIDKLEKINGNTILITSARPGEGKTLIAINLAISIAQKYDRTVLLVDANLKNPMVHSYLGIDVDRGLSDVLLKEANIHEVLINPSIPRFIITPAGRKVPGSAELLNSPTAEIVFHDIKTRYPERLVILDSPSIL